jgi:hypothetical protein
MFLRLGSFLGLNPFKLLFAVSTAQEALDQFPCPQKLFSKDEAGVMNTAVSGL